MCFSFCGSDPECLPEVGVDGVVGFPLSLGRRDPVEADFVPLFFSEVLALELVD